MGIPVMQSMIGLQAMIALILFLTVDAYLSWSWLGPCYGPRPLLFSVGFVGLALLFLSQGWLFYIFFQSSSDEKIRFEKPLQKFAFLSMGMISFLFTFSFIKDLCTLPLILFGNTHLLRTPLTTDLILAFSVLCFLWGLWNARFQVTSPVIEVPLAAV